MQNADRLDSEIIYMRDFDYDYFGFKARPCSLWSAGSAVCLPCLYPAFRLTVRSKQPSLSGKVKLSQ